MIVNELDIKTKTGATVGEIVFSPLLKTGVQAKIVDLGARSGMFELAESYTSKADFVGFEPNQIEFEKLVNKTFSPNCSKGIPVYLGNQSFAISSLSNI